MRALPPLLLIAPLLTACGHLPVRDCPTTPVVVEVERRVYVPVPAELTAPAPIPEARGRTVRELREVARERKLALEAVNSRLEQVRQIAGEGH